MELFHQAAARVLIGGIDVTEIWTWFLAFVRLTGVFLMLPGIGTEQVPQSFRIIPAAAMAACLPFAGVQAPAPNGYLEGGTMLGTEFLLGVVMGMVPLFMTSGFAVAGHAVAGAIGLTQANMIDPSLGESVSIFSRLKGQIGILVFLGIGGHHIVLRAALLGAEGVALGSYRPSNAVTEILIREFADAFQLGLMIAAPVLVSALITQFVLGLINKFVPTMNVYTISFPLVLLVGLFIVSSLFPAVEKHAFKKFANVEELIASISKSTSGDSPAPPAPGALP